MFVTDKSYVNIIPYDFISNNDGFETETSLIQEDVEDEIIEIYENVENKNGTGYTNIISERVLTKEKHIKYVLKALNSLPSGYQGLNSSQPWFCYWTLNSLYHLQGEIPNEIKQRALNRLRLCKNSMGGFGGSSHDLPHLLATYAAVSSLVIIGGSDAFDLIDKEATRQFLLQMKRPDGSFNVHPGGEIDLRGSYCAIVVAYLLDILTEDLVENVVEFVKRCQNYDGGFGPYPGVESHGSYSFCAIAILDILGRFDLIDLESFSGYAANRQMAVEGGFSGRTNKLVDGCYSYWVGAIFPILHKALGLKNKSDYFFDRFALQRYIILCCQKKNTGGLRDKPGKYPDYYHTSYCLSGLSLAQYLALSQHELPNIDSETVSVTELSIETDEMLVYGDSKNLVQEIHPTFNLSNKKINEWMLLQKSQN
ncbi:hypothetical protein BB559_001084 [Furculomyces boomerangus]|uniref:Protein farnesyltransferase subunit beta n=2 Tax=Harpellales TaxID=61421 RepID=A0A2T9Z3A5_9FUNG|nr:hypothetical protein BB559_001084 [Furculomyces boomerangus]PWA03777.1 hypothetical protein BB558_000036 [Smittium angustum]